MSLYRPILMLCNCYVTVMSLVRAVRSGREVGERLERGGREVGERWEGAHAADYEARGVLPLPMGEVGST